MDNIQREYLFEMIDALESVATALGQNAEIGDANFIAAQDFANAANALRDNEWNGMTEAIQILSEMKPHTAIRAEHDAMLDGLRSILRAYNEFEATL